MSNKTHLDCIEWHLWTIKQILWRIPEIRVVWLFPECSTFCTSVNNTFDIISNSRRLLFSIYLIILKQTVQFYLFLNLRNPVVLRLIRNERRFIIPEAINMILLIICILIGGLRVMHFLGSIYIKYRFKILQTVKGFNYALSSKCNLPSGQYGRLYSNSPHDDSRYTVYTRV